MSRPVIRGGAALLAVALTWSAAGCADPNPHAEVKIRLDEYSLHLSPGASDEGAVKMFVDNTGKLEHSLVFIRAKKASELPLTPEGSVDLSKVQIADQLKPVKPGKYRIAPDLFSGPLVVLCNLVTKGPDGQPISHFKQGMVTELTIRDTGN